MGLIGLTINGLLLLAFLITVLLIGQAARDILGLVKKIIIE